MSVQDYDAVHEAARIVDAHNAEITDALAELDVAKERITLGAFGVAAAAMYVHVIGPVETLSDQLAYAPGEMAWVMGGTAAFIGLYNYIKHIRFAKCRS